MSDRKLVNVAASVRQRLLNRARAEQRAFQELTTLYAMERFLYRLGASEHAERFVLKGGLMTLIWAGEYARLTRDIDLLGRGPNSVPGVARSVGRCSACRWTTTASASTRDPWSGANYGLRPPMRACV